MEGIQTWRTMVAKSLGTRSWETRMAYRMLHYGKVLFNINLSQTVKCVANCKLVCLISEWPMVHLPLSSV